MHASTDIGRADMEDDISDMKNACVLIRMHFNGGRFELGIPLLDSL